MVDPSVEPRKATKAARTLLNGASKVTTEVTHRRLGTRRGYSRTREFGIGLSLVVASVFLSFVALELAVRTLGTDEKRWQLRNFLRDANITEGRWRVLQPDSSLGYVPRAGYSGTDHAGRALLSFDENRLRIHRRGQPPAQTTPPVLVVGDSYAMGEEVADNETYPAHLEEMLDRRVLNAGVVGYGLDQVVLRAEKLVPRFLPDTLVVSFIADDVRRTQKRILWGIDKPYFEPVGDDLVLRNVPVPPPAAAMEPLDPIRSVLGYSFLIDVLARRLELDSWWLRGRPMHAVPAHDQGPQVACLLMDRFRRLGEAYRMRVLVVAKYTPEAWQRESTLQFEEEAIEDLLSCANQEGLETLDTQQAMQAAVMARGVDHYYINRHKNDAGNRLAAELTAKHLRGLKDSDATRR